MRISPRHNCILAAVAAATEINRLTPHLELIYLPPNRVLYESGDLQNHVYFPINAIVSLYFVTADGDSAEIAVVGQEGLVGITRFLAGDRTMSRAVVHGGGFAYRMPGRKFRDESENPGQLQYVLRRYAQALLTQIAQTAVCNRHHVVDQQLCRRLLVSLDRSATNTLSMTQELTATMLGVRRERITEAASKLKKLGVIDYSRGQITVLDRARLERLSCECYSAVKRETDRLLRPPPASSDPVCG